jgi:hypothetical protein
MTKISRDELRRHYEQAVRETESMKDTEEGWRGFIVGFRLYERLATHLGLQLTEADSKRFGPIVKTNAE